MNSLALATEFEEELIRLRRYFHAHPEVSWEEWNTQKKIIEILEQEGIRTLTPYKTAVIAFVSGTKAAGNGDKTKKILGIRADIDALPLQEKNTCSYISKKITHRI